MTPYTKIKKGPAKKAAQDKNNSQSHGMKNPSVYEQVTGAPNMLSRALSQLTGQTSREETKLRGQTETGPISDMWGDIGKGLAAPFGGNCGPLPMPCWQIGLIGGGVLLLVILLKR